MSDALDLPAVDPDEIGEAVVRVAFGDRIGLGVFLGSLLFFGLYWRVGFFSTDNYAVANTLVGVADGGLHVTRILYGPDSGVTPGMHVLNGRLYGRNYGLVFAALPVALALEAVSLVADPRIAVAGVWSLLALGLGAVLGDVLDAGERALALGALAALGLFAANVAVATPLDPYWFPVIALQTVAAVASALVAVTLYRLAAAVHGRRAGAFAGVVTAVGTPVGFWATIPKRHGVTALFAVIAVYAFYRSRAGAGGRASAHRALAYVAVGATAWVHAAEALVLLIALVAVDPLTAPRNGPRQLAAVAGAFLVSLLPFALTNLAIAGDPLEVPRLLPNYAGRPPVEDLLSDGAGATPGSGGATGTPAPADGGGEGTPGAPAGETGKAGTPGGGSPGIRPVAAIAGAVGAVASLSADALGRLDLLSTYLDRSLAGVADTHRLFEAFVHAGYLESSGLPAGHDRAINLAVVESMPLIGALFALPVVGYRRLTRDGGGLGPARATDALVVAYLLLFGLLYLDRLPLHHMLTVRYLHPLYPLAVYGIVRTRFVRRLVRAEGRTVAASYALAVGVGTPAYVGGLAVLDAVQSEAVQLYALASLLVAGSIGAWSVLAETRGARDRVGAALLGIAVGAVTTYLLVSGFVVFAYTDEFLLPIGRVIAELLRFVNPLRSLW